MGKAIVIDGLQVTNPLCTVTFSVTPSVTPVENALRAYLAANTSINSEEKSALEAFVQGLIDNSMWSKIKAFYPMLGSNVDDLILEVNGESELLGGDKGTLSADGRNLSANIGRTGATSTVPQILKNLDFGNLSIFASSNATVHQAYSRNILYISADNNTTFSLQGNTFAYPSITCGSNSVPIQGTGEGQSGVQQSYLERIVAWNIKNGSAVVYKDGVRYASTDYAPIGNIAKAVNILSNIKISSSAKDQPYKYSFLAFADGMSESEISKFYELQLVFLKTIGKHS